MQVVPTLDAYYAALANCGLPGTIHELGIRPAVRTALETFARLFG